MAKEVCDSGRISINGRPAKAGAEVASGDVLTIRYGQKTVEVKVVQILENPSKDLASTMFEVLSETHPNELD